MKLSRRVAFAAGLGTLALGGPTWAVQLPAYLAGKPALEAARGPAARPMRMVTYQHVPRAAQYAFDHLLRELGGSYQASWDEATGVPSRIFGTGVPAPNTVSSGKIAEAFSRAFLDRHLSLLAPGAHQSDFTLATNDLDRGLRTVSFIQHHSGMRVLGGQISFRFKADRLIVIASEALPRVHIANAAFSSASNRVIEEGAARAAAAQWILADAARDALPTTVEGPFILPLIGVHRVTAYHTVLRVMVSTKSPIGSWAVYLDAETGAAIAREQTLRFAEGTVLYNTPVRYPLGDRADFPAQHADQTVNGLTVTSSVDGKVSFADGASASLVASVVGPLVKVNNDTGPEATQMFSLEPEGTATWNASNAETIDAQLATFIHAHKVKAYTKSLAPSMTWLNSRLQATVNIDDVCNAFSDGSSINFFLAGSGCENTGRLADVVYHEFGHSFHYHATLQGAGEFESSLSEGVSDYLAATITGDPAMGRGFFLVDNAPLRHIDPPNKESFWPDDLVADPHENGLIIAGALWDLRKALVSKLGQAEGVAHTDRLYYMSIKNAVDIPSMYVEVLATDDDDGNLENGTPNGCEINDAFKRHGLRSISAETPTLGVAAPTQNGFKISLKLKGNFSQCEEAGSAKIQWRLRSNPASSGSVPMTGGQNQFEGVIPPQTEGEVVQYQVVISLSNGDSLSYPDNPADPLYEFFVGAVAPIYCTDFENDPEAEGWTHGLSEGEPSEGADDWQWSTARGSTTNGDPPAAFSGTRVFGNDLSIKEGFNGLYQSDKVSFALSPVVDVAAFDVVRLQYRRWLNVEDGFFDQASIYVNEQQGWANLNSDQGDASSTQHRDREWRFQDVELTPFIQNGKVQIKFEIASDSGLEFGGWTLDDFCIVGAQKAQSSAPICGNGVLEASEGCDSGGANSDTTVDACRSNCLPARCGDGVKDTAETCDDGNALDGDGCDYSCQPTDPNLLPNAEDENAERGEQGCGCRVTGSREGGAGHPADGRIIAALALGLVVARRRRGARSS